LLLAPELLRAAPRAGNPNCWALLSDAHIPSDRGVDVRGANLTARLEKVVQEVLDWSCLPQGVIVCGDCAWQRGEPGDYAALAGLVKPLRTGGMTVHLALGNHDKREHFWSAFPDERAAVTAGFARQTTLLRMPLANWFILDSLEKTMSSPGLLGTEQLQWLARSLDANPGKPALVLLHHNPGIEGGNIGLKDTEALFGVMRPRRQVKACVYGHTHAWATGQEPGGIHLVNLPSTGYAFHEGTACGWVRATLQTDGMQLELRCLDPVHKDHGRKVELKWRT
jgi:3',5'-cyclic-AMP phosphodiesterase